MSQQPNPSVESADPSVLPASPSPAPAEQPAEENASQSVAAPIAVGKGPLAARHSPPGSAKPASPAASPQRTPPKTATQGQSQSARKPASPAVGSAPTGDVGASAKVAPPPVAAASATAAPSADSAQPAGATDESAKAPSRPAKLSVPNVRQPLAGDLQDELERELAAAAELEAFLGGAAGLPPRREPLEDGQRVHGTVLKTDDDGVFVSLGGPDQGVIPREQCPEEPPAPGSSIEVIIRGLNVADSLYQLSIPGEAITVTDWSDIEPGAIVEATITAANSGGLECTVAGIRGFMPISQISEHRVEDATDFVGQKLTCVVTESNPRRGNLVVSHRAILEREREQRRQEQLESISVGDLLEGVVRTVKDFGAFVDLGGLEGLIHISKLSWDRIKHPSEVIEVGQKVKVKVDKLDPQTGKISLSYRDLLENPWDVAADTVMPGAVLNGTVTRIAAFGAFVRIAAGVEGLVHISEIAGHRVTNVGSFLNEGQEVQVKVISMDRDAQKISLSIKQAVLKAAEDQAGDAAQEEEIEVREPAVKATHQGPLRGGNNRPSGGEKFGLRW